MSAHTDRAAGSASRAENVSLKWDWGFRFAGGLRCSCVPTDWRESRNSHGGVTEQIAEAAKRL